MTVSIRKERSSFYEGTTNNSTSPSSKYTGKKHAPAYVGAYERERERERFPSYHVFGNKDEEGEKEGLCAYEERVASATATPALAATAAPPLSPHQVHSPSLLPFHLVPVTDLEWKDNWSWREN